MYLKQSLISLLFFFSLICTNKIVAQETYYQTLKGTITDQDSKSPVIGANVMVLGSDPILGSSTDVNGDFKIVDVPVGRITLVITNIGYEQRTIPNVVVGSAKEVVINATLVESLVKLDEIVIRDKDHKSILSNEMVQVSGRAFSVEETNRYAGTLNDPARAVVNFAGIQGNAEGSNHIVVRGNSPNNIQWRMEGVEIPNPNHFAEEGSSGGAINILNGKMLTNSDFYTGAFTADYGNVLAGVFDMKMRTGNRDNREYSIGVGIVGMDATVEGPFKKGGKSSYLANYRYSTLDLLDNLGVVDFGGVPKYQDLAFKLSFPTNNAGLFTVFGLGGASVIKDEMEDVDSGEILATDKFSASMGTLNLGHTYFFNNNTSIDTYVAISQNGSGYELKEDTLHVGDFQTTFKDRLDKTTLRAGTSVLTKINARNTLKVGMNYNQFMYDFKQDFLNEDQKLERWLDDKGDTGMIRAFASWKHRLNEDWTATAGLSYVNFLLSESQSIEPRASIKYQINDRQSLSAGFGIHSQMASLPAYFSIIEDENGNLNRPNMGLDLMKAAHYVVGYDNKLSDNLYFKIEAYYQSLYDIPVENDINSSYSLLNATSGFSDRVLVNNGTGKNYGLEFTLERYFANQYYFLITTSLFQSKYKALDGIERNTAFNTNHLANFLVGKEFYIGGSKNKVLSLNTKVTWTGGNRYTPLDLTESEDLGYGVYDEDLAYGLRGPDVFKWDLNIGYSWNKRKTRQTISLEIQNLTNHDAKTSEYYNSVTGGLEMATQLPMFPNFMYTLEF